MESTTENRIARCHGFFLEQRTMLSPTNFPLCLAAILAASSSAFGPNQSTRRAATSLYSADNNNENPRRAFLQQVVSAGATVLLPSTPSFAGLLDDFGTDPSKIVVPEKAVDKPAASTKKGEAGIDPALKVSYYYPTAKKRYAPRIIKLTTEIEPVPQYIANGQWEEVQAFANVADNTVLPLQLYVSSLDGQGLNMANSYAKVMKKYATIFEQQYKLLTQAIKKKDQELALSSVQAMALAVTDYRQVGRLTDDAGNIPSVDEIKRSTMRRTTQAGFTLAQ